VLYSVPNYTAVNASILAEWVYDNYGNELLETVMRVLNKPPDTGEKIWRLTPDTVSAWMSIELEKFYGERERQINNAKYEEVPNEWKDERLKELEDIVKKVEDFKVPSLTESDIIQEAQELISKIIAIHIAPSIITLNTSQSSFFILVWF